MEHKVFYSFLFSLCHLISARSSKYSICVKWVDKQENELARKGVTMSECAQWVQFCQHVLTLMSTLGKTVAVSKPCFPHL